MVRRGQLCGGESDVSDLATVAPAKVPPSSHGAFYKGGLCATIFFVFVPLPLAGHILPGFGAILQEQNLDTEKHSDNMFRWMTRQSSNDLAAAACLTDGREASALQRRAQALAITPRSVAKPGHDGHGACDSLVRQPAPLLTSPPPEGGFPLHGGLAAESSGGAPATWPAQWYTRLPVHARSWNPWKPWWMGPSGRWPKKEGC